MARLERKPKVPGGELRPSAADEAAEGRIPYVVAFLTQTMWTETDQRQTGTILLLAEQGKWKAWVNDRDTDRSAWVSADTLLELLGRVEKGLATDDLGWRANQPRGRR